MMGKKIVGESSDNTVSRDFSDIDFDVPLQPSSALAKDKLSRGGFAEIAAVTLRKVTSSAGFVLSIEGPWGSGKSSTLAMIEALLTTGDELGAPIIVHFNPWLVGEKDALLRQFLSRIASAIKLSDRTQGAKKVATAIKAYGKVFDLVKLIPGAEPWASMIKSVVEATGDATGSISEYKTPDVEEYKLRLEEVLRKFERPIIVFIDDIDRLFPNEVFEMIRIIKAVGGLPRVGYVVAWDSSYVIGALENLGVPQAGNYLDKIVQVRMSLPNLSLTAREKLLNSALEGLDPSALHPRFAGQDKRMRFLFHSGLRDFLNQPRDIARVFNALRIIEPLLRGEIVLADILGLAALSVKAPAVFEMLKKKPHLFVGRMRNDILERGTSDKIIKDGNDERRQAYEAGAAGGSAQKMVHFLFPEVAVAEKEHSLGRGSYVEGVIAHPARLAIALQLGVTDGDVSIKAARSYLQNPNLRRQVVSGLTSENCDAFVEMVGEVGVSLQGEGISDMDELCLSIARLVDEPLFVDRALSKGVRFSPRIEDFALQKIYALANTGDNKIFGRIAMNIAKDDFALSCAAEILRKNYGQEREEYYGDDRLVDESKADIIQTFATNVQDAGRKGELFEKNRAGFILRTLALVAPQECSKLLTELKIVDPTLDRFALVYFMSSWDSSKGDAYSLHQNEVLDTAYCTLEDIKKHASMRLKDEFLEYPAKAVWRSLLENKSLYGVDGTEMTR